MSLVRAYAAQTVSPPDSCTRCWPGLLVSTLPGITVNAVSSPAVETELVSWSGGASQVRWAMPKKIMAAATTKATMAETNRTVHHSFLNCRRTLRCSGPERGVVEQALSFIVGRRRGTDPGGTPGTHAISAMTAGKTAG